MSKRSIDTDTVSKLRKVEIQIPEITSIEHFKEVCKTTTKGYIVFDFYATWCPPCRRIGTRLPELVEAYPSAQFYKVDRDRCMEVHRACSVQKIPTFIVYDTRANEHIGRLQHSDYDTVCKFLDESIDEEF